MVLIPNQPQEKSFCLGYTRQLTVEMTDGIISDEEMCSLYIDIYM